MATGEWVDPEEEVNRFGQAKIGAGAAERTAKVGSAEQDREQRQETDLRPAASCSGL
jgi:hypothetical protein